MGGEATHKTRSPDAKSSPDARRAGPGGAAHHALALQQSAGNAAVSALLDVQRLPGTDTLETSTMPLEPAATTSTMPLEPASTSSAGPPPTTGSPPAEADEAPPVEHPMIRRGSRGDDVSECQTKLNLSPDTTSLLDVDGIFGSLTNGSVVEFQTAKGLAPDGIVGPLTWAELDKVGGGGGGGGGGGVDPVPTPPTLQEGDGPSDDVGLLQQKLNAAGASPRLRITGLFQADTTAAVRQFQASFAFPETGVADPLTRALLDQVTVEGTEHGVTTVDTNQANDARGVPAGGTIHPTIRLGDNGPAVEECQQRLANDPTNLVPVTASGNFDAPTDQAVKLLQNANGLTPNGVVDAGTWNVLDNIRGPVTVGREDFQWKERVEGTEYGGPSKFTWRIHPDRMEITVNIQFLDNPSHAKVAEWKRLIHDTWSAFNFVDPADEATQIPLEFVVGSGTPDAQVHVVVDPPDTTPGRSNASNWHTGDDRAGLAPHEFGHLIGLQDEYNQLAEHYVETTGHEAFTGGTTGDAEPDQIAQEMRAAVTDVDPTQRGPKAKAVVTNHGLVQGGFAQRVAAAYKALFAPDLQREDLNLGTGTRAVVADPDAEIATDIAARIPSQSGDETAATEPFLYSNSSVMGTMGSVDSHDHPVATRHVRHFLELFRQNRPGNWELRDR
jgi:peptidoglycan hydrolase-like protein with peptidoglycan-binding domain